MRTLRSMDTPIYAAPTIETISLSVERGFANSFPGGDVEPMFIDYSSDGDIVVEK